MDRDHADRLDGDQLGHHVGDQAASIRERLDHHQAAATASDRDLLDRD